MLKTNSDIEAEMAATAHAETYVGNHQSLDDPLGNLLRKAGAPRVTAKDTLKMLRSGYLYEQMAKSDRGTDGLRKVLSNRNTLLIRGTDGVTRELVLDNTTPQLPTVNAIRKALQHRQSFDPDRFFKGRDLPPQDADTDDEGALPDHGATQDWSTQGETANAVRADLLVGREHAASMHDLSRAPRVVGDGEVEVPTDASRSSRERRTRTPTLPPPDTATPYRGKDPNADDREESIKAIAEAQRHPKALWGE